MYLFKLKITVSKSEAGGEWHESTEQKFFWNLAIFCNYCIRRTKKLLQWNTQFFFVSLLKTWNGQYVLLATYHCDHLPENWLKTKIKVHLMRKNSENVLKEWFLRLFKISKTFSDSENCGLGAL